MDTLTATSPLFEIHWPIRIDSEAQTILDQEKADGALCVHYGCRLKHRFFLVVGEPWCSDSRSCNKCYLLECRRRMGIRCYYG